ncbi:MAG: hypothetical protein ABUT20_58095, partial [Bacteroidota bacterium]
ITLALTLIAGILSTASAQNFTAPVKVTATNNVETPSIPKVLSVADPAAPTKTISLGYSTSRDAGILSSVHAGTAWKNTLINPYGGNVAVGPSMFGGTIYFQLEATSAARGVAMFGSTLTGNTSNVSVINASSYNYGVMGVISGHQTIGNDMYGLGYTSSANSSFNPVLNWTSSGKVGIGTGTGSPDTRLQVAGDITAGSVTPGQRWLLHTRDWAAGDFFFIVPDNASGTYDFTKSFGIQRSTGNVGIGSITTWDPAYKLSVKGAIRCQKVLVDITWADYVFHKDYKLMSIPELEKFVVENKHLPNIPAGSEIEKNGLDLGTVQAKQMEKIEELTLYIIELNKKMQVQNQRIVELEKASVKK